MEPDGALRMASRPPYLSDRREATLLSLKLSGLPLSPCEEPLQLQPQEPGKFEQEVELAWLNAKARELQGAVQRLKLWERLPADRRLRSVPYNRRVRVRHDGAADVQNANVMCDPEDSENEEPIQLCFPNREALERLLNAVRAAEQRGADRWVLLTDCVMRGVRVEVGVGSGQAVAMQGTPDAGVQSGPGQSSTLAMEAKLAVELAQRVWHALSTRHVHQPGGQGAGAVNAAGGMVHMLQPLPEMNEVLCQLVDESESWLCAERASKRAVNHQPLAPPALAPAPPDAPPALAPPALAAGSETGQSESGVGSGGAAGAAVVAGVEECRVRWEGLAAEVRGYADQIGRDVAEHSKHRGLIEVEVTGPPELLQAC